MKTTGAEMGIIYVIEAVGGNPERIGEKYVGQSRNFKNRKKSHKCDFGFNRNSIKMQRYYNKYGEDSLKMSVLGHYPIKELNFWERFFIKCFDSKENGFNCDDGGQGGDGRPRKCRLENMVTGEIVESNSIKEFADKYGLDDSSIAKVLNKKLNYCKDWFAPDNKWRPKIHEFISPTGEKHLLVNHKQSEFARKHNLFRNSLNDVILKKQKSHRGWIRADYKEKRRRASQFEFFLINPEGEKVRGFNMRKFARDNGMKEYNLRHILKGGNSKASGGWKLYKEKETI